MIARFFCLCALLGGIPLPGLAADWHEVGTVMEPSITVYVDHDTLKVDHDVVVQGWVRYDYAQPQPEAGLPLSRQTARQMVNCESRRYWTTERWGYPSSGGAQVPLPGTQEWQLAPPDSEAEMAVQALCAETQSVFGWVWGVIRGALSLHNN